MNNKLLSTKKLNSSLLYSLQDLCFELTEHNFITIEPITTTEKKEEIIKVFTSHTFKHIIFTSSNAVEVIRKYRSQIDWTKSTDLNMYSIRGKTSESLMAYFRPETIETAKNSNELGERVIKRGIKEVVYFCGDKRRDELPLLLHKHGVSVKEIVVYQTMTTPIKCEEIYNGILFFSPSAVESFFSVNDLPSTTVCLAIGNTTAQEIKNICNNKVIVSATASEERILKTAKSFFCDHGS
jgi:uroporphyrinogen-III synthase